MGKKEAEMVNTELSEILDDQPATETPEPEVKEPAAEPEKGAEAEPEAPEETGEKEEAKGETPSPDPEPKSVPMSAFLGVKEKLKTTEQRLNAMEAERTKTPAPDRWEDPDGYEAHKETELSERLFTERCNVSYGIATRQYGEEDFQEKADAWNEAMAADPSLQTKLAQSDSPAHFIYEQGEAYMKRQEIGDPGTFEQRVRERVEAEMAGKVDEIVSAKVKEALSKHLPNSLAEETTTDSRASGPAWEGPTPLAKLIGE